MYVDHHIVTGHIVAKHIDHIVEEDVVAERRR